MALFTTGLSFITGVLTKAKAVKTLSNDFIGEIVAWVRPYLIKDDPTAEVVLDLDGNEAAKTKIIEAKLPKLLEDETFKKELEAYMEKSKTAAVRRKNIVDKVEVESEGSVHIGDKNSKNNGDFDEKNIVTDSKFKIKGDWRVGDDG